MPRAYWLVKSEPSKYSWDQLVEDGRTLWDGVRNYEARNNLQAMKVGDLVLYYHSSEGKEVVGVARIVRDHYPDPTSDDEAWVVVDVEPVQRLEEPVSLATVKADPALAQIALVKRGRISVVPVTPSEFERVLALGRTGLRPDARPEKLPPREVPPRRAASGTAKKRARGAAKKKGARAAGRSTAAGRKKPGAKKKRRAARTPVGGKRSARKLAGRKGAGRREAARPGATGKRPTRKAPPRKGGRPR